MDNTFIFETTMKRKCAPPMNLRWTRKPTKKKKLNLEFEQFLDKLWEDEDGK